MEPHRPEVDREVLALVRSQTFSPRAFIRSQAFTPRDFMIDAKVVCRLHPELAKTVSGLAVSEVLLRESVGGDAAGFRVPDTPQGPPGDGLSASENSSASGREPIVQVLGTCSSPHERERHNGPGHGTRQAAWDRRARPYH